MIGEGKLVALVAGHDTGLMVYASMLHRYHQRALPEPERPGVGAASPAQAGTVVVDKDSSVVLGIPSAVRYIELPDDQPLQRLLALSEQEDVETLLVPESAGRHLACRLSRTARCAVWFIPNGAQLRLDRILVPVDFSVRAADSLRAATGLASLSAASCDVLHVWKNDAVLSHDLTAARLAQQAVVDFARFLEPIDCLNVAVTRILEEAADVAGAITRVADERHSDLIVLTTRGRRPFASLLRPSLVEQVLAASRVPVLVLKHFAAPLGVLAALRHRPEPDLPCN